VPELLLELLSEEIPARMQARAADDLKRLVTEGFKKAGLDFTGAQAFVTPRRLALVVDGIPEKLAAKSEERRGPATSAPEQAVNGFKGSLPKGAKIEKRGTEKGEFFFAVVKQKGGLTKGILAEVLVNALTNMGWPKSMRWGENNVRWVRPVHGILCIFGGKAVALTFGHVKASDAATGHRFLSPKPFKVKSFKDYQAKLLKNKVMLDASDRAAVIEKEANKLAKRAKLKLKDDPALLAEVAGLVEWPVVKMGSIDKEYMGLPPEVLTTTMRSHQKYFALTSSRGKLAPNFIVVANTETRDRGKAVVAGNERVLRARLSDAKFFWDLDRKQKLDSRIQDLGGRVFHAKLGTVLDKVLRVEQLASFLAQDCGANKGDAGWAARLAKADLSTGMVGEFPELQGVMGRYYALNDGEKPDIADAIAEHYSPAGPGDACPKNPVGIAVALADKIDTLAGFWAIGEKPTGSKDPFALRRAALGVIRLVVENGLRLKLLKVFDEAAKSLGDTLGHAAQNFDGKDLLAFIADRLKVHLREKGVKHDHIDAVFSLNDEDDLVRLLARVDALSAFLKSDDGGNLLIAYKRAANIVRIEEKNDARKYAGDCQADLLEQDEEMVLANYLDEVRDTAEKTLFAEDFTAAMAAIARLRKPVDKFFDRVTVNCKDRSLRENRLLLLSEICSAMNAVADFSRIEGGEQ